jgi:ribosomal subunit interface protein
MQLSVTGHHLDVGDALRSHVEQHLTASVAKYFDNAVEANVVFKREAHLFCAEISVHVGRGMHFVGRGEADAPYPAFDLALEHTAKQMRRDKRKRRDHRRAEAARGEADV